MTTLTVGIIGAGQIAALHAKGYQKDNRVRIHTVCDNRENLAIKNALEWGADRYTRNWREVIADHNVDLVDICTPNYLHAPIAYEALRAGKHVMVQRPLALTVAEADRLIQEARRRNLTLCMAEPLLFHHPINDARGYLESGEIGDPISIRIKISIGAPDGGWNVRPESWLWRFDPKKCGGGPFLFDSIYASFAQAHHLMGKIGGVQAWLGKTEIYPGYFVDAPATMMWRHENRSCPGSMELSYSPEMYIRSSHYPTDARVEVTGTKGVLWIRSAPGNLTMAPPLQMYRDGRLFSFGEIDDDWGEAFERMTAHFVDAVSNTKKLVADAAFGREVLRLTLAAQAAHLKSAQK